jgi:hypothetical protein
MASKPFTIITLPNGLEMAAVSTSDAILEAAANEEQQVYFGRGNIHLSPGAAALQLPVACSAINLDICPSWFVAGVLLLVG